MSEGSHRFKAVIVAARGGGAAVEIPFSVREAFGTGGQVKVRATFDGHEYHGSLAPMGDGVHRLGVRKDVRAAIGKDIGDTVNVFVERDTVERIVVIPVELGAAFEGAVEARRRFDRLSYTHRKEYAQWVAEAKKPETRERRAGAAIEMLKEGKTR